MEVGLFLIKLLKIIVLSYFAERIIRVIEKAIKLKIKAQQREIYDKEFWGDLYGQR